MIALEYFMGKIEMIDFLEINGIRDKKVLEAMKYLTREDFVLAEYKYLAYEDCALPIGYDATISQPLAVAMMLEELKVSKGMKVLEVGSGSGYVMGLLKLIVGSGKVIGLEVVPELVEIAKNNLKKSKIDAKIIIGDGRNGYSKEAPYDRILVSCACENVPDELFKQLKIDGIMVVPIGLDIQQLVIIRKSKNGVNEERKGYFRFVRMK